MKINRSQRPSISRLRSDISWAKHYIKLYKKEVEKAKIKLKLAEQALTNGLNLVSKASRERTELELLIKKCEVRNVPSVLRLQLAKNILKMEGLTYYCDKKKKVYSLKPDQYCQYWLKKNKKLKKLLNILADKVNFMRAVPPHGEDITRYYFKREDYVKKETTI